MKRSAGGLLVLSASLFFVMGQAHGQDWGSGMACPGGWFNSPFGWNSWAYTPDYVGAPPYFSLRPPVYYDGVIERRSYGDSPFPYSAERSVRTEQSRFDSGHNQEMILNPFVKPKDMDQKQSYGWKLPDHQLVQNPHR